MRVGTVSAAQMRAVDEAAIQSFGISLDMMMENAGRAVAAGLQRVHGDLEGVRVLVAAGPGNNGGGGLAAVRHLLTAGAHVEVILARPLVQLLGLPRTYAEVARAFGVTFWRSDSKRALRAVRDSDWVVDALLGYNQEGPLRPPVAEVAEALASDGSRVVALDVPTGMNPDTGRFTEGGVRADATVALGLPKLGFGKRGARKGTGAVLVASLGFPDAVFVQADVPGPYPRFETDGLVAWP